MAKAIVASNSKREAWFFYGVRNRHEHIHQQELEALAAENENIRLHVCYSRPAPDEVKGRDYHHEGRVSIELLKELLPSNNFEYYLCGNGAFMKSITDGLEAWGVPEKDIHFEAFGPATVKKKVAQPTPSETVHMAKMPARRSAGSRASATCSTSRENKEYASIPDVAQEAAARVWSRFAQGPWNT
jgi:ferredoxin-NADP reductase